MTEDNHPAFMFYLDRPASPYSPVTVKKPIYGYRGWAISGDDKLCSLVVRRNSFDGPNMYADCRPSPHNESGLYVVWPSFVRSMLYMYYPPTGPRSIGAAPLTFNLSVLGRVRLYGRTVMHRCGARAEHIVPEQLWVMPDEHRTGWSKSTPFPGTTRRISLVDKLAQRYQCDVTKLQSDYAVKQLLAEIMVEKMPEIIHHYCVEKLARLAEYSHYERKVMRRLI